MIRRIALFSAVLLVGILSGKSVALGRPEGDSKPSVAERYRAIVAEYEGKRNAAAEAAGKAKTVAEQQKIYVKMMPDDAAFSRKMIELAVSSPNDPASRDALVWVIDKTNRLDIGDYGDQVGLAVRLLVDNFGNDPEAARLGLSLHNTCSRHRDALMEGMYASAENREAKGLARMSLARYLQKKAELAQVMKQKTGKESTVFDSFDDDGKPIKKTHTWPNEMQGYFVGLRLLDPYILERRAEALYREILADYGDIPHVSLNLKNLEKLIKEPAPMWNGMPMSAETMAQIRTLVDKKKTLGDVAKGYLDELQNVSEGKPAPEIVGKDLDGRPMKLSDYRGKVVVLVFWGSWCGPCMAAVPHERELTEKYQGKPFTILGVNCNEKADAAKKTVEREKMAWPHWYDGEELGGPIVEKYHVRGYPTLFVIDREGIIRRKNVMGEELDKAVEELMKEMTGS